MYGCLAEINAAWPADRITVTCARFCRPERRRIFHPAPNLMYANRRFEVTYTEKIQIYLRKEELDALRNTDARSGRSVAELGRDAIRKVLLEPQPAGPVAIW